MAKYSKEDLFKIYKTLPEDLKEQLWSEETADSVRRIGQRNGLEEIQYEKLVKYVGFVFNGILPPNNFAKTIERDLKLTKEIAEKVTSEIDRFVFSAVKDSLSNLYGPKVISKEMKVTKKEIEEFKKEVSTKEIEADEEKPTSKDAYREIIE